VFYAGVDLLILFGAIRDWLVSRQIHVVYKVGLPLLIVGQSIVMYAVVTNLPLWVKIAQKIIS
jgi:hypothetical protein